VQVLILSHMFPRVRHPAGGIFVHDQVRALRAHGVDARVVSGEPFWVQSVRPQRILAALRAYSDVKPVWNYWETVPVLHFPYLCGYLFRPSIHAITYVQGLKRILPGLRDQFPFDVVHAHTSFLDGSAGLAVRAATGCPVVITEHTGPFSLLTRNRLMRRITRRAVVGVDRCLAVSDSLKQDMIEELGIGPESVDVLPNGVDTRVFRPRTDERRRVADGFIRALWVGHHVEIKRVDRLLHAFARASLVRHDLHLTLLGDGPECPAMEHLATELGLSGRVTFQPAADRGGVADAMRAHDFLVVSSSKETFSLVALEALSCGIPVLSTACGGPESFITEPSFGMIVSNNVDGLTQGLITMPERLGKSDSTRLHAFVDSRYPWARIAEEVVGAYRTLLAASARHTT
jgi:glycosyltransferase involved in cell wall biosynthesis